MTVEELLPYVSYCVVRVEIEDVLTAMLAPSSGCSLTLVTPEGYHARWARTADACLPLTYAH